MLSTPSHFTLPLSVAMFQSQYSTDTAKAFAYTALSMLPALFVFVFVFAQRYLVGGLVGAIRGLSAIQRVAVDTGFSHFGMLRRPAAGKPDVSHGSTVRARRIQHGCPSHAARTA